MLYYTLIKQALGVRDCRTVPYTKAMNEQYGKFFEEQGGFNGRIKVINLY